MSLNIAYSSEVYELDPQDLLLLRDSTPEEQQTIKVDNQIVLLIGNKNLGTTDTLARGRDAIKRALNNGVEYVPVRVAFVSQIPVYNILPLFIKKLRYKHKFFNTNIYHLSAKGLRNMGIERGVRTAENAYAITNKRWVIPESERIQKYQELAKSLENGFSDDYPLSIMLCRRCGYLDSLDNGHHRMGICIKNGIDRICTNFIAAGSLPLSVQSILLKIRHLFKRK